MLYVHPGHTELPGGSNPRGPRSRLRLRPCHAGGAAARWCSRYAARPGPAADVSGALRAEQLLIVRAEPCCALSALHARRRGPMRHLESSRLSLRHLVLQVRARRDGVEILEDDAPAANGSRNELSALVCARA